MAWEFFTSWSCNAAYSQGIARIMYQGKMHDNYINIMCISVSIYLLSTQSLTQVFRPKLWGTKPDPKMVAELEEILVKSKDTFENYFLKNSKFIAGDQISVADLQAICEFTQFWVIHIDPAEGYPKLAQWMKDVQAELKPVFDEVHKIVYQTRDTNLYDKQE